jgi:predicted DNA-binding transcriptional regulator AlpA
MTHHLVGMAEIAEILGVSRQRVSQLIETYEDFPKPEVELSGGRVWSRTAIETWIASHPQRGPGRPEGGRVSRLFGRVEAGLFNRFTDRARHAIVKAQEEARLLDHNFIGTEHVLLGLIAIGEGLAFQVLTHEGIRLEAVRSKVEAMIGRGTGPIQGHIPFTPRAKKVLEIALREAKHLNHNYIGTEHVLLGIIREGEGVAAQALEALGAGEHKLRAAVIAAMKGLSAAKSGPISGSAQAPACSFCEKPRDAVKTLVAGPGSIAICDECIMLAAEVSAGEAGPPLDILQQLRALEERIMKLEEPPEA